MTATAKTKRNSRTWAEWMGPDAQIDPDTLMTRTEFIEELNRQGLAVSAPTLAYWENKGILPRGIKGRRNNAPQALYPPVAVPVVRVLRRMQEGGSPLDHIAHAIRGWPAQLADLPPADWRPEVLDELLNTTGDPTATPEWAADVRAVIAHTDQLIRSHARMTGEAVVYAELRIISASGKVAQFKLAPRDAQEEALQVAESQSLAS